MKDHEITLIVNQLRDVAKEYGQTQQLRERIANVIVPVLSASKPAAPLSDADLLVLWAKADYLPQGEWLKQMHAVIATPQPAQTPQVASFDAQKIYDEFSFLEGLVSENTYRNIAEKAIEIVRDASPQSTTTQQAQTDRALTDEQMETERIAKAAAPLEAKE